MTDALRAAYDATPYDSKPISATHLDNLATIARLHGLTPPPPEGCRVLELGCASGGNLIPMAAAHPASRFVGIDLSPRQIELAQGAVRALGLTNISFETRSILDIDEDDGPFDYIIAHGVYSWVPSDVQDAILRVCEGRLSANGIAYISYNTYPGWHVRMMARQMMMANDDPSLPPMERVGRARAFIKEIGTRAQQLSGAHGVVMRAELAVLDKQPDSQLLHEQLEPFNDPVLFTEFARRASCHGLRYLADARNARHRWPKPSASAHASDIARIHAEQVDDFVLGQTFRRSLLVREDAEIDPGAAPRVIRDLHVMLRAVRVPPSDDADEQAPGVQVFGSPEGARMGTANPLVLAAFHVLGAEQPRPMAFRDLESAVGRQLGVAPDEARAVDRLPTLLLEMARADMVEFSTLPPRFVIRISEKPVTTPLARWQARTGASISDLRHWSIALPPLAVFLLGYLDGGRDTTQLVDEVEGALRDGRLSAGQTPDRGQLEVVVGEALRAIALSALLVA